MKLFRTTLTLLCIILFSSCMDESAYCPTDRNIVLNFAYVYNGSNVFDDNVQSVSLFVFDNTTGLLVHNETIDDAQLSAFAGTTLNHLAPGDYRVVAWGNALPQRSAFGSVNEGDHINDAYVGRHGVPRSTAPQSGDGDRLHFAPGLLTIQPIGDLEATLSFARAYIEIEVFVVDLALHTGDTQPPIIEIDDAASHYDFNRVPEGNITLRETTAVRTEYVERPAVAMFRTKLFDNNANLTKELRVHSASDENIVHFTIDNAMFRQMIAEFMADNNIHSLKADAAPQRIIPITIEFRGQDVNVSVNVPVFELEPGNPIF